MATFMIKNKFTKFCYRIIRSTLFYCSKAFIRFAVTYSVSRRLLNLLYSTLSFSHKAIFHKKFSKVFSDNDRFASSGHWQCQLAGNAILIPLRSENSRLDWDSALSIEGHDAEVKETYEYIILNRKPDIFIDIGTNFGGHSLIFLCQGIDVFSFEPNSSCHSYFLELCTTNHVSPNLMHIALGANESQATIKYPLNQTWLGSTNNDVQIQLARSSELIEEQVTQKTLDSYIDQFKGKELLIKIDTEGNEYEVLLGANKTITECNPKVIFESWKSDNRKNLFDFFQKNNFILYDLPWQKNEERLSFEQFINNDKENFIAMHENC